MLAAMSVPARALVIWIPILLNAVVTMLSLPAADCDALLLHVQLVCALVKVQY